MNALVSKFESLICPRKTLILQSIKSRIRFFSVSNPDDVRCFQSEKFVSCLENCSGIVSLKRIHSSIFTYGFSNSNFLCSKLLNCYAKLGFLNESRLVCDRIVSCNLSLWNSILIGYFRSGFFYEVVKLYLNLRKFKIGLDSQGVTFSLKSCIELGFWQFGRGIHVDVLKVGLGRNRFVGSSLIGLYFENGDTEKACKVFDEIAERDVVVYTSMITGYAQIGDHRGCEAFWFARKMQKERLDPNRVTLVSLLHAAAQLEVLEEGRTVHGYAIRRGIGCGNEVFETSLMDMYVKCGASKQAACIFGELDVRTIGSWNSLIAGHLQAGHPLKALKLFSQMVREKFEPDLITLANGILSCVDMKYLNEGKSIHAYIIRMGVQLDLVATTALIDLYSKCNKFVQARELFDKTEKKDAILCNVLMAGYLECGLSRNAIETFNEINGSGIKPNVVSILCLLSASSELRDLRQGSSVHGYMFRQRFDSNIEISNQAVCMYAKCGCIDYARKVFDSIKSRDLVSWTSMMMGYVHQGHTDDAIILFWRMQRENLNFDSITFTILLQAFAQIGCLNLTKEVHCLIYRILMEKEMSVINSLITTYAKCGELKVARHLFEQTKGQSRTSWNAIIAAYGMHGNSMEALRLFDQMKNEKVIPDEITFTSLLSACSHSGLVEEGLHTFRSMTKEFLILPREEHYSCVIDLLSRAGRIEEAYDLLKFLTSRQRSSALGTLLSACRVHTNMEMGEVIGKHLLDLEPDNPSVYALVSNLFAEGGKWEEAARIRALVKEKGIKMIAGYSLLELDNQNVRCELLLH